MGNSANPRLTRVFRVACVVTLTLGTVVAARADDMMVGKTIATQGTAKGVAACISCHGAKGEGSAAAGFPRLAGVNAAYLSEQLSAFAGGERQSTLSNHSQNCCRQMDALQLRSTSVRCRYLQAYAAMTIRLLRHRISARGLQPVGAGIRACPPASNVTDREVLALARSSRRSPDSLPYISKTSCMDGKKERVRLDPWRSCPSWSANSPMPISRQSPPITPVLLRVPRARQQSGANNDPSNLVAQSA